MSPEHALFGVYHELQQAYGTSEVSGIPAADRPHVIQRSQALLPALERWAGARPSVAPARCAATLLACVAATPREPAAVSLFLTKVALTLFAIDDLADGEDGDRSDSEIEALLARYRATVAVPQHTPWPARDRPGQIGRMLQALCRRLRRDPRKALFYPIWQDHMERVLDGFIHELRAKRAYAAHGTMPAFDEYMAVAQWSIALPAWCMAALGLLADPAATSLPPDQGLERVARAIGIGIRLANDVRTVAREHAEGKFNSLTILMRDGMAQAAAEREIVARADAAIEALVRETAALPPAYARWGAALVRQARFSRDYYLTREFHHLAAADLASLAHGAAARPAPPTPARKDPA